MWPTTPWGVLAPLSRNSGDCPGNRGCFHSFPLLPTRPMTELAGKTIWITGASSGIGEALALAASRRGARLVLSARRESELERVRQACARPDQVALLPVDLAALDDADGLARRAESLLD